ncbi:MAG TPA: glycosyltransferase [Xanthobacteraceae bacterium]
MRILLTADPFLPVPPRLYGGIERVIATLTENLRARGHVVGLVAVKGSTALVDHFRPWRYAKPDDWIAHSQNAVSLMQACGEFGPSVIHSFSRLLYLAPLQLRRIPKIMSYQRTVGGSQIRLWAALARGSLTFTGCSEFIASMGRAHGGVWHAIPNFVDTSFYRFSAAVPAQAPLLFLSRIEEIKGTHLAIDVAKRTGRRLLIAGNRAESGAEGVYWETRIKPELGRNGIEYVGPVDDRSKLHLLESALALIVPIQWDEPFGIVFAEALACGTPVIACPRGALPEIVRHGVDGFLVSSVDEACRAVAQIGSIDRRQCRARAESAFSASVVTGIYEALYETLVRN